MKLVTPKQMGEIDKDTINLAKIPGIVLMENAAGKVFYESLKLIKTVKNKTISIFAGRGNNGGDALAVARLFYNSKANVKVFIFDDDYKGDAKINFEIVKNMGIKVITIGSNISVNELRIELEKSDLIIDGIFGTGLKGVVSGEFYKTIDIINESKKRVVSIDIPSGVSGLTGEVLGISINASLTVCFGLPKVGMYKSPGEAYIGELKIVDISIPEYIINKLNIKFNLLTRNDIKNIFPKRYKDSNKGTYGKLFLITGSKGMTGAGILSAEAAYKSGAGIVYLGVPNSLVCIYNSMIAEAVCKPISDRNGFFLSDAYDEIVDFSKNVDVLGLGPGISNREDLIEFVEKIIEKVEKPIVLDADALNIISRKIEIFNKSKGEIVITPHPGEMSRLTGITIKEIQSKRIDIARDYAAKWNVIIVLKGNNTVIATPKGEVYINETGNNGMATAGSGDVLTGMIMSIIGQGRKPKEAALIGTYLHGLAGDYASEIMTEYGTVARDIIYNIPVAIKKLV